MQKERDNKNHNKKMSSNQNVEAFLSVRHLEIRFFFLTLQKQSSK